jgi:hypothetical protein
VVTTAVLLVLGATAAWAKVLFSEGFEGNLGRWSGAASSGTFGVIVPDPIRSGNHVLAFTHLRSGGDIFSPGTTLSKSGKYHLAFDFLGKPNEGGGILGISLGTPSYHRWLVGTQKRGVGETNPLVDDGKWHHYTITVVPDGNKWFTADGSRAVTLQTITKIHIMIEQNWGTPGTAYFDNFTLSTAHG